MASLVVLRGDQAATVYDDRWLPVVAALGALTITRATEVEYEHEASEWTAVHLESGATIGRGVQRGQVIDQEVHWLEQRMSESVK